MIKRCEWCGTEFEYNKGNKKYCSGACANSVKQDRNKDYQRRYRESPKAKQVRQAWKRRQPKKPQKPRKTAQDPREYARKYRQTQKYKDYRRKYFQSKRGKQVSIDAVHRRRALMKSAAIGIVDYLHVDTKDGLVCKLCGKPIDLALVYPDPMSKSYDHIIPLSKGGSHSTENLQLTHYVCNVRKNNGGGYAIDDGARLHASQNTRGLSDDRKAPPKDRPVS